VSAWRLLAVLLLAAGCATAPSSGSPEDAARDAGVVLGVVAVEGWREAPGAGRPVFLELRHRRTGQRFVGRAGEGGRFALSVPPGSYVVSALWSGSERIEGQRLRLTVVPGHTVYVGTLAMQLPDGTRQGRVEVLDRYDEVDSLAAGADADAHRGGRPLHGLMFVAPRHAVVVSLLLDGRVLAPFVVAPGVPRPRLALKVAQALALVRPEPALPGPDPPGARGPQPATIGSIRIGEATVTDVEVDVDVAGELRLSVLGPPFLDRLGLAVDRQHGEVGPRP